MPKRLICCLAVLLYSITFSITAQAQDVDCEQFPNSAFCPGAAPSPGPTQPAPPFACPGYAGMPGANSSGLVILPSVLPLNCCDELIIFGDGSVLPPHPQADRATAQAWANDAFGSDSNTNRHYYLAWWTLYFVSGVSCSGGAL